MRKLFMIMVVSCFVAANVFATALTEERDTPGRSGTRISLMCKTNETIYAGSMVSVDSSGLAVSSSDTASDAVIGRAVTTVSAATNLARIEVDIGVFRWEDGSSSTLTDANIGDIVYVLDDQTITNGTGGSADIIAGTVFGIDASGVWIKTGEIDRTAGSFTTLSVSGAATLSSTLGVTGAATFSSTISAVGQITAEGGLLFTNGATILNQTVGRLIFAEATNNFNGDVVINSSSNFQCYGRAPILSAATTAIVMEDGTNVLSTDGTCTNVYTTAFASAPRVYAFYNEAVAGTIISTNAYPSSQTVGSNIVTGVGGEGINWIAIGTQ